MVAVTELDSLLVQRCQANDAAAFNEIVERYKHRVHNYICRMVGSTQDAEDLAQEVFVKAYVNIRSFQSRATLNTWLFRIATNLCIDYSRRNKRSTIQKVSLVRESPDEEGSSEWEVPDERFAPEQTFLNTELGDRIQFALDGLPEKLRTVVVLHDIEGLPYEDIAQIVAAPLGTVKSRLFNARAAMRSRLLPYLQGTA